MAARIAEILQFNKCLTNNLIYLLNPTYSNNQNILIKFLNSDLDGFFCCCNIN